MVLHLFLLLFVEKSYFTFKLTFDSAPSLTAIFVFWHRQNIVTTNEFPILKNMDFKQE